MKNVLKFLTIAGLVLAVTLAFASCDDGKKSTPMIPAGGSKWKAPKTFSPIVTTAFVTPLTATATLSWEAPENQPKDGDTSLLKGYAVLYYVKGARTELGTEVESTSTPGIIVPIDPEKDYVFELYAMYTDKAADTVPAFTTLKAFDDYKQKAKFKDNREAKINYPIFNVPAASAITTAKGTGIGNVTVTWTDPTAFNTGTSPTWKCVGVGLAYTVVGTDPVDITPIDVTFNSGNALAVTNKANFATVNADNKDIYVYFIFDCAASPTYTDATAFNTHAKVKGLKNVVIVKKANVEVQESA